MKNRLLKIFCLGAIAALAGCTDLEEKLFDQYKADGFIKSQKEAMAVLAPAYGSMRGMFDLTWEAIEYTGGTMLTPTRGQHWYEGGRMQRAHLQTFDYQDAIVGGPWNYAYGGIATCNRILYQLAGQEFEGKETFISEVKMIRAYYFYIALSNYGRVPFVDRHDVEPGFLPEQLDQDVAYERLITELNEIIPNLTEEVSPATYGRWTKWAGLALRARVYLNAHMYKSKSTDPSTWGTPEWEKCIADCEAIINSGNFSIESDYFVNFKKNNEASKEIVMAVPYDEIYGPGWFISVKSLHYQSRYTFGLNFQPWNGMCAVTEFYTSFDDTDKRKKDGWLIGQQYDKSGKPLECTEESKGQPLIFVADGFSHDNAKEYHGARLSKFEIYEGALIDGSNDFPLLRMADVYMMKAECLWRQGNIQGAADIINQQIRSRVFEPQEPISAAELTEERLLDEMRWEFFGEMRVRQDQRRFGKLSRGQWLDKPDYGHYDFDWLCIPKSQLDANSNLKQNPGELYQGMQ
jgi:hypothetical protein